MNNIKNIYLKNQKTAWRLISVFAITLGYYLYVYNSFGYKSWNCNIGMLLIVLSLSLLYFPNFELEGATWLKMAVIMLPFLILITVSMSMISSHRTEFIYNELRIFGVNTHAVIKEFETVVQKGPDAEYAVFYFSFNQEKYIQRIDNYNNIYKINQIINIRISKKNPEMFEIIDNN